MFYYFYFFVEFFSECNANDNNNNNAANDDDDDVTNTERNARQKERAMPIFRGRQLSLRRTVRIQPRSIISLEHSVNVIVVNNTNKYIVDIDLDCICSSTCCGARSGDVVVVAVIVAVESERQLKRRAARWWRCCGADACGACAHCAAAGRAGVFDRRRVRRHWHAAQFARHRSDCAR
jgi:hypothetical protein